MNEILVGSLILIASCFYFLLLIKDSKNVEEKKYTDYWDLAMQFKGWVGGILFFVSGIILILKGCNNL